MSTKTEDLWTMINGIKTMQLPTDSTVSTFEIFWYIILFSFSITITGKRHNEETILILIDDVCSSDRFSKELIHDLSFFLTSGVKIKRLLGKSSYLIDNYRKIMDLELFDDNSVSDYQSFLKRIIELTNNPYGYFDWKSMIRKKHQHLEFVDKDLLFLDILLEDENQSITYRCSRDDGSSVILFNMLDELYEKRFNQSYIFENNHSDPIPNSDKETSIVILPCRPFNNQIKGDQQRQKRWYQGIGNIIRNKQLSWCLFNYNDSTCEQSIDLRKELVRGQFDIEIQTIPLDNIGSTSSELYRIKIENLGAGKEGRTRFVFNSGEPEITLESLLQSKSYKLIPEIYVKAASGKRTLVSSVCRPLGAPDVDIFKDDVLEVQPSHFGAYGFLAIPPDIKNKKIERKDNKGYLLKPYDLLVVNNDRNNKGLIALVQVVEKERSIPLVAKYNGKIFVFRSTSQEFEQVKRHMIALYRYFAFDDGRSEIETEIRKKLAGNTTTTLRKEVILNSSAPVEDIDYQEAARSSFEKAMYYRHLIGELNYKLFNTLGSEQQEQEFLLAVSRMLRLAGFAVVQENFSPIERGKKNNHEIDFHDAYLGFSKDEWTSDMGRFVIRVGIEPTFLQSYSHCYWGICLYDESGTRIDIDRSQYSKIIVKLQKELGPTDDDNDTKETRFLSSNYFPGFANDEYNFCSKSFRDKLNESDYLSRMLRIIESEFRIIEHAITKVL